MHDTTGALGRKWSRWTAALVMLVLGVMVASPVFADAASRYREQLQALRAELATQAEQDEAKLAQDDIAQIAAWLDQAERALKERETEQASFLLKRAEYGLDLVRALAVASQIEAKASEQEGAFSQSADQVAALKAEVTALQSKKAELNQQLNQLR